MTSTQGYTKNTRKLASVDYDKAISVFTSFNNCTNKFKKVTTPNKKRFRACTDQYMSNTLTTIHKDHLSAWLFFDYPRTSAHACKIEPRSYEFPEQSILALCFDITLGKKKRKARIYFSEEKGELKIIKVAY